jgi:uncharacterized phage protein gp47/JayE
MNVTDLAYIDSTGYNYSDYPTFLAWLQGVYQGIYGADVYLGADSQDGQFVAILAQAFFDTAALGASVYNSFSPVTAQGVGLSRLVRINGLTREVPSFSTVTLAIGGVAGTVITNGIAQDILNQQWILPSSVTIPGGGTINVTATSQVVGAITADASTITTIFTPTLGWQTVNNAAAATPGAPVESDAALRIRQSVSTSLPAQTVFDATIGAIENLSGVTDVQGYENATSTIGGGNSGSVSQPAHSISIVVTGGTALDICQTIQDYKTPGTQTYGSTTETVYDAKGMPLAISYQQSVIATIGVQVTITEGTSWTSEYAAEIQNAVAAAINAGGIGNTVRYTTLFLPAYLNGTLPPNAYVVVSIELNYNGGSFSAADVTLAWDEQPVCNPLTDVAIIT